MTTMNSRGRWTDEPIGPAFRSSIGWLIASILVPTIAGCNGNGTPADVLADADTAEVTDEWVRRFPERSTCDRESAIPYSTVEDWVGCWNERCDEGFYSVRGQPLPVAGLCRSDERLHLMYVADRTMEGGPWVRLRDVRSDGTLGPAREVDITGVLDGEGLFVEAVACHDGRFRVATRNRAVHSGDSETDPELPVIYLVEVDPESAAVVAPPKYLNGVGRGGVERLTIYSLLGFRQDGERLFYAGSERYYGDYALYFSVGEYDLDWDGVWDEEWHSWARWISGDMGDYYDQLIWRWAAPVGDRIAYAWVDWLNGYTTGHLAIGPRPNGLVETLAYDSTVSIEDLMQAGPMPRSGFLQMAVGTRTLAAACDDWMLVFDHDLERVGRPVNFGSLASGGFHYRVLYGGGYYAVIHSGIAPDPGSPYEVSADFAISVVNEDAEFVDRKVLLCPTDGLPNTLPNYDSYLMDAYWNGEGFWMVFATQPLFPGPWELRVFFLPVP